MQTTNQTRRAAPVDHAPDATRGALTLRLSGNSAGVRALLDGVRELPGVDGVTELSVDMPQMDDDSSSAGLSDDTAPAAHQDVRVQVPSSVDYDFVHGRIELLAARTNVVLEWLDED